MNAKKNLRLLILSFFVVIMTTQIFLGFLWMIKNLTAMPVFGDSAEYYKLSQSLIVDEYRTIFYPLLLRGIVAIGTVFHFPYQTLVYLLQTLLSFVSILYFIKVFDKVLFAKKEGNVKKKEIWEWYFTLYLLSIPMITFMNFTILTDSISTSMMLLFIGGLIRLYHENQFHLSSFIIVGISLLIECLTRADRIYNCFIFVLVYLILYFLKNKTSSHAKKSMVILLVCAMVACGSAKTVNQFTQHPGAYNRITTSFDFILLDRIVWPHMADNYHFFPDEIKEVLSYEDALTFDTHNNNVMYQLAPLLYERVGKKQAEKYFVTMASIVFEHQTKRVLFDIIRDIFTVVFTPFCTYFSLKGLITTAAGWNVYCMSTTDLWLTEFYNMFYLALDFIIAGFAIIASIISVVTKKHYASKILKTLWPLWSICLIITLWFCLGDGAPPNDRYALLHHFCWSFAMLQLIYFMLRKEQS